MVRTLEEKHQTAALMELMMSKMPWSEVEKMQIRELIKNADELEQIQAGLQTSNTQDEDIARVLDIIVNISTQAIHLIVGDVDVDIEFKISHTSVKSFD